MLSVKIEGNVVRIGERLTVSLQRTLRIPDDGRRYPLPPGLGVFPLKRVADYAGAPPPWRERGGVFIPSISAALWLDFDGPQRKPNAVKIGVGAQRRLGRAVGRKAAVGPAGLHRLPTTAVARRHQRGPRLHTPVRRHASGAGPHRRRPVDRQGGVRRHSNPCLRARAGQVRRPTAAAPRRSPSSARRARAGRVRRDGARGGREDETEALPGPVRPGRVG